MMDLRLVLKAAGNAVLNRLALSYALDWIFIAAIGIAGKILSKTPPVHRSFSLMDPEISFPKKEETVSSEMLRLVALIIPGIVMALVILIWVPGSAVARNAPKSTIWRYKLWELNAAWLGLALAFAATFATAKGLKVLAGKPRPDLLDRCDPDVSHIAKYAVGGLGMKLPGAPIMVSWEICQNKMKKSLYIDGFTSFPSDHSALSFAGLTYFSFWLCSKFSISFPYLAPNRPDPHQHDEEQATVPVDPFEYPSLSIRREGAAPPVYGLVVVAIPIAVATFVAASRWYDNRHHGPDILCGSALGVFFAFLTFRLYNMPIQRGGGWSWGPRSHQHAFLRGIGIPSHTGSDNWASGTENGRVALD